jgi:hypothetical protein
VAVIGGTAYPTGFEFEASLRTRRVSEADADLATMWHPRLRKGEIPPEFLRLGVEFSDGAKATNLRHPWFAENPEEAPGQPVLIPRAGSGSGANWDQRYWVWPLPPVGPFAFVCEWPAEGIPLTRAEIDGASIRAAADQAELLWDEQPADATGSSWSAY